MRSMWKSPPVRMCTLTTLLVQEQLPLSPEKSEYKSNPAERVLLGLCSEQICAFVRCGPNIGRIRRCYQCVANSDIGPYAELSVWEKKNDRYLVISYL